MQSKIFAVAKMLLVRGRVLSALAAASAVHSLGYESSATIWAAVFVYFLSRIVGDGARTTLLCVGVVALCGHLLVAFSSIMEMALGSDRGLVSIAADFLFGQWTGITAFISDVSSLGTREGLSWARFFAWMFVFALVSRVPASLPESLNEFGRFNLRLKGTMMSGFGAAIVASVVLDLSGLVGGIASALLAVGVGFAFVQIPAFSELGSAVARMTGFGSIGFSDPIRGSPVNAKTKPEIQGETVTVTVTPADSLAQDVVLPVSSLSVKPAEFQHKFNVACKQAEIALWGRSRSAIANVRLALSAAGPERDKLLGLLPEGAALRIFGSWFAEGLSDDQVAEKIEEHREGLKLQRVGEVQDSGEGLSREAIETLLPKLAATNEQIGGSDDPLDDEDFAEVEEGPAEGLGEVESPEDLDAGEESGLLPDDLLGQTDGQDIVNDLRHGDVEDVGEAVATSFFGEELRTRFGGGDDDGPEWLPSELSVIDRLLSDVAEERGHGLAEQEVAPAPADLQEVHQELDVVEAPGLVPNGLGEGAEMTEWREIASELAKSKWSTERSLSSALMAAEHQDLPTLEEFERALPRFCDVVMTKQDIALRDFCDWFDRMQYDAPSFADPSSAFLRFVRITSIDRENANDELSRVILSVFAFQKAKESGLEVDADRLMRKSIAMFLQSHVDRLEAEYQAHKSAPTIRTAAECSLAWEEILELFQSGPIMTPEYARIAELVDNLAGDMADPSVRDFGTEAAASVMARQILASKLPADIGVNLDLLSTVAGTFAAVERSVQLEAQLVGCDRDEARLATFSDACIGAIRMLALMVREKLPGVFRGGLARYQLPEGASSDDDLARLMAAYRPALVKPYLEAIDRPVEDPIGLLNEARQKVASLEAELRVSRKREAEGDIETLKAGFRGFASILENFLRTPTASDPRKFPLLAPYRRETGECWFVYETKHGRELRRTLIIPVDGGGATFTLKLLKGKDPYLVVPGAPWRSMDINSVISSILGEIILHEFHDVKFLLVGGQLAPDAGTLRADMLSDEDSWANMEASALGIAHRGIILFPADLKPQSPALSLHSGMAPHISLMRLA